MSQSLFNPSNYCTQDMFKPNGSRIWCHVQMSACTYRGPSARSGQFSSVAEGVGQFGTHFIDRVRIDELEAGFGGEGPRAEGGGNLPPSRCSNTPGLGSADSISKMGPKSFNVVKGAQRGLERLRGRILAVSADLG